MIPSAAAPPPGAAAIGPFAGFRRDPDDAALEAYFARRRDALIQASLAELLRVAVWLPIIDLPANDIGVKA